MTVRTRCGRLDVVSATPSPPSAACAPPQRRLEPLATENGEISGLTASICIASDDLGLERVAVIYPGAKRYPLGDAVEAVPLKTLTMPGSLFDGESPAA